ncbi:RagB/SusD family nutrient uptake outer membrane protein [Arcicella lustrica]|uniref:RagB/SusD family nutrient uptake outer membrane protein n=1 Tax=Arcicella lustrica TaxID=2984196 RepID=A0ABU5SQ52_9BACT|nr:RagB/SusD family nutrient uptake outer membrane protein [Arcicella sp. DC25W]MEA5429302.1 RagB/SusD family nutrient uptake outer membrane protein [Arcicella sp. DC25W]
MKKYLYLIAVVALSITGCRDYVEIEQIGVRTFKYTSDYRAVLNNNDVFEGAYGYPILAGDDTEFSDVARQNTLNEIWGNVYTWRAKFFAETISDIDWEKLYKTIYTSNEVIAGVMASERGTEAEKQSLYSEALVHRAYTYLSLVNIYAKQYDATTASTDLGVPLLLTPNLYTKLNRASVETVYNQIIGDLKSSIKALPAIPDYNVRPSKAAAYALLSRVYLNKRDFTQASLYADSTLALQNGLLDLKTYVGNTTAIPQRLNDPEIIFSKTVNGAYIGVQISNEVLNLLGTTDLRYTLFTNAGTAFSPSFVGRGYWRYRYTNEGIYIGPSVPEMILIKAECAARAGNPTLAISTLNQLRIKRFTTANYIPLTIGTAQEALMSVINERKRELFGRGFRWFDQKRLNKESNLAMTVNRTFKGQTYTLSPNDNRYVFPIADKYILLNPELEPNP